MGAPMSYTLVRPTADAATEQRWSRQTLRWQMMSEDFGGDDRKIREWFESHVGAERLAGWGPADISANTLGDVSRQLTTPGLYGLGSPTLSHAAGADAFAALVEDSGYWTRQQETQFMTVGMGDWVMKCDVIDGELDVQPVMPFNLWTRSHPRRPSKAIEVRNLMIYEVAGRPEYRWESWDISDPANPRYAILDSSGIPDPYFAADQRTGADYWWRYADGRPFIPFVFYARTDTGQLWHDAGRKGATRGALNTMLYWSYVGVCARDSSGTTAIAVGVDFGKSMTTSNEGGAPASKLNLQPGCVLVAQPSDDTRQPMVVQLQPGVDIEKLRMFAEAYEMRQLTREGLAPDDVTRDKSNPTSAAALSINNSAKRQVARRLMPFFRRSDLEMLGKMAAIARVHGLGTYPETGYSIAYEELPLSTDEMEAARAQAEWDLAQGFVSKPRIYARRHGVSVDDAVVELRKVQEENARVAPPEDEPDDEEDEEDEPEETESADQPEDD